MQTNGFLRIVQSFLDADLDGCWEWPMCRHPTTGYGHLAYNGRRGTTTKPHRLAYELLVRPLRPGEFVMHTCDNPPCFRPDHLRAGTHAENMADMKAKGRSRARITECSHGHPYTAGSWFYQRRGDREYRTCLICKRARSRVTDHRRGRKRGQAA